MAASNGRVRTGIAGREAILGGGIPRGNVTRRGRDRPRQTTMGVEFVYRGIQEFGEPGSSWCSRCRPDRLARDAAGLGWDSAGLEARQQLKIIYTTREVFRRRCSRRTAFDEEANKIGARRIFIDGAAGLLPPGSDEWRDTFTSWSRVCSART